jgi:hypothetical protein
MTLRGRGSKSATVLLFRNNRHVRKTVWRMFAPVANRTGCQLLLAVHLLTGTAAGHDSSGAPAERRPAIQTGPAAPGRTGPIAGVEVERYCREGRIAEVAAYCETDVVNTYRVWLRYELFCGRLSEGVRASEANLSDYIRSHSDAKPHGSCSS